MRITITETGVQRSAERIDGLSRRSADAKPVFNLIADELIAHEAEIFSAQPWKPLAAETVARKMRAGQDPRIMHATGALAASLTSKRAPGQKLRIGRLSMTFGTKLFYARFAQGGTKHEPVRQVTAITGAEVEEFANRIMRHLMGEL